MDEFNRFLDVCQKLNKKLWIRQVIIPGINDTEEHIKELAKFAKKIPNVEKVELLPYHTYGMKKYEELNIKYRLKDVPALSKDKEAYLNEILNSNLKK